MSENMEQALEHILAGILFCVAIAVLLWFHGMFMRQIHLSGRTSVRLILAEQSEGEEWNHSEEP